MTDSGSNVVPELDDGLVREQPARAEATRRTGRNRLIGVTVSMVVIGLVFAFVLPKIGSYRAVWRIVGDMPWAWVVALIAATVLNILTFAPPWMGALPGLAFLDALRVTLASTALSLVAPGGAAVGIAVSLAMLKRRGLKGRPVGVAVAVTSIWNQAFIMACPVLVVVPLLVEGGHSQSLELVASIALALLVMLVTAFAMGLRSPRLALKAGNWAAAAVSRWRRLTGKQPARWTGAAFVRFRSQALDLLRRRWHVLTIATLANQLADFGLMILALRATGVTGGEVDILEAFAAWALARALGALPITPGGIGVVELTLTATLVGFGADGPASVAGTLVYRSLQIIPILSLGLLSAATWKLGNPRAPTRTRS